eukprot:gene14968-16667_t
MSPGGQLSNALQLPAVCRDTLQLPNAFTDFIRAKTLPTLHLPCDNSKFDAIL